MVRAALVLVRDLFCRPLYYTVVLDVIKKGKEKRVHHDSVVLELFSGNLCSDKLLLMIRLSDIVAEIVYTHV